MLSYKDRGQSSGSNESEAAVRIGVDGGYARFVENQAARSVEPEPMTQAEWHDTIGIDELYRNAR